MEEAVTRKFVHEDSSSITSLCGAYITLASLLLLTQFGRAAPARVLSHYPARVRVLDCNGDPCRFAINKQLLSRSASLVTVRDERQSQ